MGWSWWDIRTRLVLRLSGCQGDILPIPTILHYFTFPWRQVFFKEFFWSDSWFLNYHLYTNMQILFLL